MTADEKTTQLIALLTAKIAAQFRGERIVLTPTDVSRIIVEVLRVAQEIQDEFAAPSCTGDGPTLTGKDYSHLRVSFEALERVLQSGDDTTSAPFQAALHELDEAIHWWDHREDAHSGIGDGRDTERLRLLAESRFGFLGQTLGGVVITGLDDLRRALDLTAEAARDNG